MKIFLILTILFTTFCACQKQTDTATGVVDTWKLVALRISPGTPVPFQAVQSNKTVTFTSQGAIFSNGDLCTPTTESNSPTSGTYSITNNTFDANCNLTDPYTFQQIADTLIISYPCIEACEAKYIRL